MQFDFIQLIHLSCTESKSEGTTRHSFLRAAGLFSTELFTSNLSLWSREGFILTEQRWF